MVLAIPSRILIKNCASSELEVLNIHGLCLYSRILSTPSSRRTRRRNLTLARCSEPISPISARPCPPFPPLCRLYARYSIPVVRGRRRPLHVIPALSGNPFSVKMGQWRNRKRGTKRGPRPFSAFSPPLATTHT